MKVVLTGSREWSDIDAVLRVMSSYPPDTEFIFGDCPTGLDFIALQIAKEAGLQHKVYRADWNSHGRAAGPIRNAIMLDENLDADIVIAFGDHIGHPKKCKGTWGCVRMAKDRSLKCKLVQHV